MAITFTCQCGKQFQAGFEYGGKRAKCPACKREFTFPVPGAEKRERTPEPPPLPTIRTDEEKPTQLESTEVHRPWWKDPIIVYGGGTPLLFLVMFFGYVAWPPNTRTIEPENSLFAKSKTNSQPKSTVVAPNDFGVSRRNPKIPIEVSYPVLDEYRNPPIKHGLNVLLNMKVSEAVLREIALELKSHEVEQYKSTYIGYFLPEMDPENDSWWACSDFNPTLKVEIRGLTAEQEKSLLSKPLSLPEGAKVIGSWVSDSAFHDDRMTIFRNGDTYYLQQLPLGGGTTVRELLKRPSTDGLDFQITDGRDHYLIDRGGNLVIRDDDGIVLTARKVDSPRE